MVKHRLRRFLILVSIVLLLLLLVAGFIEYCYQQEAEELASSDILKGEPYDGAIVLGTKVADDGSISHWNKARMDKALQLYHERKVAKIIVTGGDTNRKVAKSEAKAMYEYALINGVPESDIVTEERSDSTVGNAYYVKTSILEPKGWRKNIVVTSDFHLTRTRLVFSKVLGEGYVTTYLASCHDLSASEMTKKSLRERGLYLLHKVLFLGIRDGDHEKIRSRFERFGLPVGTPAGAATRNSARLSHTWPLPQTS